MVEFLDALEAQLVRTSAQLTREDAQRAWTAAPAVRTSSRWSRSAQSPPDRPPLLGVGAIALGVAVVLACHPWPRPPDDGEADRPTRRVVALADRDGRGTYLLETWSGEVPAPRLRAVGAIVRTLLSSERRERALSSPGAASAPAA